MKEKIKAFWLFFVDMLKRIFTPLPRGLLYGDSHPVATRIFGVAAVALFPLFCCITVGAVFITKDAGFFKDYTKEKLLLFCTALIYAVFILYAVSAILIKRGRKDAVIRAVGYIAMAVFPLACYVTLEFVHFASKTKFMTFISGKTEVVAFGIGLIYTLYAVILLIVKKGWIASGVLGAMTVLASLANYYKYALTGDYLYPWDIVKNAGKAGQLSEFIATPFPIWDIVLFALLGILFAVIVITAPDIPMRLVMRLPLALILAVNIYTATDTPDKAKTYLESNGLNLEDMALQTSNYMENGFVGAFTVNVLSAEVSPPEGYSEEMMEQLLSPYRATPAGEDFKHPDIILILSESFWDPTLLPGVEYSIDPMANYREIASREGAISGKFYATAFGGGTIRPEFEVLTGLTTDYLPSGSVPYQYITSDTESYVSLYEDMGYRTLTIHPYLSSFYQRKQGHPYIGLNETYFEDEIYGNKDVPFTISGKFISDSTFVDNIKYHMDNSEGDTFVFGISMENHQPYTNKFDHFNLEVTTDRIEASVLHDLENYAQGVYEADLALKKLVDYIDSREKETVLVYFGDHLPTLGPNYAAYHQTGAIDLNGMTPEMNRFLCATPFLIYSNFELEESDMLKAGTDNEIASYNLMNALSTLIDAPRTRYMYFLEDYYKACKAYNVRLWSVDKTPFIHFVEGQKAVTYDRTVGKKYSF